jgi:hypothetical protein
MLKLTILVAALTLSTEAMAAEIYNCKLSKSERLITVVYTTEGSHLPCQVNYTKDGETKTLWEYKSTEGACTARAAEFAEKHSQWGWGCTKEESEQEKAAPSQ